MSLSRSACVVTLLAAACSVYAATPADLMITDGTVLTMNPENQVIEHGTVVINANKIVAVGGPELTEKYQAKKSSMQRAILSCRVLSIPILTGR